MTPWVTVGIGLVALLYAAVGHAGATGYAAVMALADLPAAVIRPTALLLNVVVATIGTVQFTRAGHFRRGLFLPLTVASVPCAAVGGATPLSATAFDLLLGAVLLASAVRTVAEARGGGSAGSELPEQPALPPAGLVAVGGGIGLLSGLVGVGGGVFLTPLLLALRAAPVKQVAAVTAPFILVNSLAGLAGGLAGGARLPAVSLVVVAVAALGGLAGSQLGAFRLAVPTLRLLVAVVLVVAGVTLLARALGGG